MKLVGCAIAFVALLAGGCGSSHRPPQTIEQAFTRFISERHPGFSGPSRCPAKARTAEPEACIGELHKGDRYVQVWAYPTRGSTVAFKHVATSAWTRRWSGYGRPAERPSPGLISVNNKGMFDWRWVLLGADALCRQKHRTTCTAPGLDGAFGGYPVFDDFHCHAGAHLVTCRNSLGDAVRWRPDA